MPGRREAVSGGIGRIKDLAKLEMCPNIGDHEAASRLNKAFVMCIKMYPNISIYATVRCALIQIKSVHIAQYTINITVIHIIYIKSVKILFCHRRR